jgi:hypothetical protein
LEADNERARKHARIDLKYVQNLLISCAFWGHAAHGIKQKAISVYFIPTIYVDCEWERWQQKQKQKSCAFYT